MLNFTDSPLFTSFVQQVANLWDHNHLLKDAKIVIFGSEPTNKLRVTI